MITTKIDVILGEVKLRDANWEYMQIANIDHYITLFSYLVFIDELVILPKNDDFQWNTGFIAMCRLHYIA